MQDAAADQALVRRRIDPDDHVVAILHQVDEAVLGDDLQPHIRIGAQERGGDPAEHHMADHHRHAHAQLPARMVHGRAERVARLLDLAQRPGGARVQGLAMPGQLQGPGAAFDQAHAEGGLQLRDAAGQGRLRLPAGAAGAAQAALGGNEVEIGEGAKIHRMVHR